MSGIRNRIEGKLRCVESPRGKMGFFLKKYNYFHDYVLGVNKLG